VPSQVVTDLRLPASLARHVSFPSAPNLQTCQTPGSLRLSWNRSTGREPVGPYQARSRRSESIRTEDSGSKRPLHRRQNCDEPIHRDAGHSVGLHLFQELSTTLGQQIAHTLWYCALTSAPDQPHNPPRLKRAVLLLDSRFALLGQGRPSKSSNFIGTTSGSTPSGSYGRTIRQACPLCYAPLRRLWLQD
jgi:hypothetical protein